MTITKEDFEKYVRVQNSGVTNMFNVNLVADLTGLDPEKILDIMENYSIYQQKFIENKS